MALNQSEHLFLEICCLALQFFLLFLWLRLNKLSYRNQLGLHLKLFCRAFRNSPGFLNSWQISEFYEINKSASFFFFYLNCIFYWIWSTFYYELSSPIWLSYDIVIDLYFALNKGKFAIFSNFHLISDLVTKFTLESRVFKKREQIMQNYFYEKDAFPKIPPNL